MRERTALIVLVVILVCLAQAAWAAEEKTSQGKGHADLKKADVNPEFTEYLAERAAGRPAAATVEETKLGFIPAPVSLQHLEGKTVPKEAFAKGKGTATAALVTALPSKFDLRTLGKVTPVKDQGSCGDCWAFATYGSLESFLMPVPTIPDFSEDHLNSNHGFDPAPCMGGNHFMSTAYLSRWDGPLAEGAEEGSDIENHVQDVTFVPKRKSSTDNTNLKNAIMAGGVYSAFYWNSNYYKSSTYAYYYKPLLRKAGSNHAITLIGWDDGFSRTKFRTYPPGNGAFLAKNSWGPGWGNQGYFWISYYDANIGTDNAAFTGEPVGNYGHVYQYDPLGWTTSWGCGANTGWIANVFTSTGAGSLNAVSFYSAMTSSPYEIYMYTGPTGGEPRSGTLKYSGTGMILSPGYHTVDIDPVSLNAGETFSVVVKLTTPGYTSPMAAEQPVPGYSTLATGNPGESYLSCDGNYWWDLAEDLAANSNVCLKAFTA